VKKYKICPLCGKHNDPSLLECTECESDLSGVSVTDKETQSRQQNNHKTTPVQSQTMIRLCECGERNPVQVRKCIACGEDISDIVPISENINISDNINTNENVSNKVIFKLESFDGRYMYNIAGGNTIIGREYEMKEYLKEKTYVSRRHAELIFRDEKLFIRNLSKTNFTYINNRKTDENSVTELHDGDEIGLGGIVINGSTQAEAAYFLVRTRECI